MSSQREIVRILGDTLTPLGFLKKGSTWRRRCEEVTQVVNLQKSNFDASFFLNIGFWIHELGDPEPAIREEQCHVRARVSAVSQDVEPSIEELLSENHGLEESERLESLRDRFAKLLGLFFSRTKDLDGVAQEIGSSKEWLVRVAAHEALGYSPR